MLTYGLTLNLKLREEHLDPSRVFWEIVTRWQQKKLDRLPEDIRATFHSEETTFEFENNQARELVLEQPADDHDGTWTTEVRTRSSTTVGDLLATVTMRTTPSSPTLTPLRYYVESPRFIRELHSTFIISIGHDVPKPSVSCVSTDVEVEQFVDFLRSPERALPVVLVTPFVHEPPELPPGLDEHLAPYLFPMAHIHSIEQASTYALTNIVGKALSCFDGGVRIYWPGFDASDKPTRHPLLWKGFAIRSRQYAPDDPYKLFRINIMAELARASAATFEYPTEILNTIDEGRAADLANLIISMSADEKDEKAAELEREIQRLKREVAEKDIALARAQAAIDATHSGGADDSDDLGWSIESVDEAIERAKQEFSTTLLFAEPVSVDTNMQGGYWFNVFRALNELCLNEHQGLGRSRGAALRELLVKHVSMPGNWKRGETSVFATNPETLEWVELLDRAHLKEGKPSDSESVYWEPVGKRENLRYLIGHIGHHP